MNKINTKGIHHLGLTVNKLQESANFFTELLGWEIVKKKEDYPAIFVSNGTVMITLWAIKGDEIIKFNRRSNIGLHHFAIEVEELIDLDKIYNLLVKNNIEIEFKPENLGPGPAIHMICFEPSGNRIEFIFPGK